jgi:hypothetical protein
MTASDDWRKNVQDEAHHLITSNPNLLYISPIDKLKM